MIKLTNLQIYQIVNDFKLAFNDPNLKLPVKISFFLNKNMRLLESLAKEIYEAKENIIHEYGVFSTSVNRYIIPDQALPDANKAMDELMNIQQEIPISYINLSDLQTVGELTLEQMAILAFMVKEDNANG